VNAVVVVVLCVVLVGLEAVVVCVTLVVGVDTLVVEVVGVDGCVGRVAKTAAAIMITITTNITTVHPPRDGPDFLV
jgi:hypothetical protein